MEVTYKLDQMRSPRTNVGEEIVKMLLTTQLTERELQLALNCLQYSKASYQGGLPGHNLILLVSKLLSMAQVNESVIEATLDEYKTVEEVRKCECAC